MWEFGFIILPDSYTYSGNIRVTTGLKSFRRDCPAFLEHLRWVRFRCDSQKPQWLTDWIKHKGGAGRKIETALIGYYGLAPPE